MTLVNVLARCPNLLLDFEGPMCSAFASLSNREATRELFGRLVRAGAPLEQAEQLPDDPFTLLYQVRRHAPALAESAERALRDIERTAVHGAEPTPHLAELLSELHASGHTVTVVSNIAEDAVQDFLRANTLDDLVSAVVARTQPDPYLLKPSPYLLQRAAAGLGAPVSTCVLLGDSVNDVLAAQRAGSASIACAAGPVERDALCAAHPDVLIGDLSEVVWALRETPDR